MPVAGETISLPDQTKKDSQVLQNGIRLHYFPNIPVGRSTEATGRSVPEGEFQRVQFKNMDEHAAWIKDNGPDEPAGTPAEDLQPSVEQIKKSAFEKGFLEGKKVGLEAGTQKVDPVINSLNQALEQLENIRQEIHQEVENEVAQLALAIAKKIVCHEVKTTRETIVCVAREALSQIENPGKIKLKLNPADLQFIEETKSQLSRYLHDVENIRFEAEESIQSGGCLIETDMGDIDARLEKQLQAIEESFKTQFEQ